MKVDFVIPWVDDRDKNWIIEKNKYSGEQDLSLIHISEPTRRN